MSHVLYFAFSVMVHARYASIGAGESRRYASGDIRRPVKD